MDAVLRWNQQPPALLRNHPCFKKVVASRLVHEDVQSLAKALSGLSIGRQQPLWEDLKQCNVPLLLIVGEKDTKFKSIARKMFTEANQGRKHEDGKGNGICEIVEVPDCGHAVHLENPLPIIRTLRQFLPKIRKISSRAQ